MGLIKSNTARRSRRLTRLDSLVSLPVGPGHLAPTLPIRRARVRRACFESFDSFDSYSSDIHFCRPHDPAQTASSQASGPWAHRSSDVMGAYAASIAHGGSRLQANTLSTCRAVLLSLAHRWQSTCCPPSREMQSVRRIVMPMWYSHPVFVIHLASHDCPRMRLRRTTAYCHTEQCCGLRPASSRDQPEREKWCGYIKSGCSSVSSVAFVCA